MATRRPEPPPPVRTEPGERISPEVAHTNATQLADLDFAPFFDLYEVVLDPAHTYHGTSFGDKAAAMNIGGEKHPKNNEWKAKQGLRIRGNGAHLWPNAFNVAPNLADIVAAKADALASSSLELQDLAVELAKTGLQNLLALHVASIALSAQDPYQEVLAFLLAYKSYYGDSLSIDSTCGDYVLIEDVTIHGGGSGCHAGIDMWRSPVPGTQTIEFRNCRFLADLGPGGRPKWGINSWNTNIIAKKCFWDWGEAVEHANYKHGSASTPVPGTDLVLAGSFYEDCEIRSCGADGYREVHRPYTSYYTPPDPNTDPELWQAFWAKYHSSDQGTHWNGTTISLYRRCRVRDWGQPHSGRGGAGFNFSASGGHVILDQCVAVHGNGPKFPAFTALTEGRYFDVNGNPQDPRDRAFESIQIRNSLFQIDYEPWLYGNNPRPVVTAQAALNVTIENSGIFGHADVRLANNDEVHVTGCNSNQVKAAVFSRFPEMAELPNAKHVSYPGGYHSDITQDLHWSK